MSFRDTTTSIAETNIRLSFAIAVLFFYDWVLTLPMEIIAVWTRKLTLANFFYLCTRYLNWLFWTLSILQLFLYPGHGAISPDLFKRCTQIYMASSVIGMLGRLASMILFTLRTWAIYRASLFILVPLCILALTSFILNILSLINLLDSADNADGFEIDYFTGFGIGSCGLETRNQLALTWYPTLVWGSLVFNAIIFFLTLYKTLGTYKVAKSVGIKDSLHAYLLRDGSMYYISVVMIDIMFIAVAFKFRLDIDTLSNLASVNATIETLLSCRLVLNLKQRGQRDQNISLGRISSFRAQKFTNEVVLGNIGAPLRDSGEEWDDFMEDVDEGHEENEPQRDETPPSASSP